MKKLLLIVLAFAAITMSGNAQKIGIVDSEYILKNVPAYESAQEQLNQVTKKWQQEVEVILAEVTTMYKNYQSELVFLSNDQKVKREEEVILREKAGQELKRKYFGPEGELFKKRESLIKPIQDEIFTAVKEFSEEKGYGIIIDKATSGNIIFLDPKLDISDQILNKLGYSK